MATTTVSGSTVTFSNSGAAANLSQTGTEDGTLAFTFDVLAASGGGKNTTVYSVDDGVKNDDGGAPIVITNKAFGDYNKDLLIQDDVEVRQTSTQGAQFWIGSDNKIYYDATALSDKINALGAGDQFKDTIQYTIKMSNGTLSVGTLNVVINGTNDAPVITSDAQAGIVKEDSTLTATGQVTSSDVDHGATAAYSGNATGAYGSFAIDAKTGAWTYTLDNAGHQDLAEGESQTETFKVTVTDDKGAMSTQDVLITIDGTNDAPVITSDAQAGIVKEDSTLTATGQVTSSDVDHGAMAAYSGNATGAYGSFAIDAKTGAWTYTLDNAGHQDLAEGESQTETFKVTVTDDKGAMSTQDVLITIDGTNDAPVITSDAQAGIVKEDSTLTATGQVTSSDVDHGATAAYSGNATGAYGSFAIDAKTGAWTYTLDNAGHQDLAEGESQTETFKVTVTDDKGAMSTQDVLITIDGTNDAAVITGSSTAALTESNVAQSTSGDLNVSDVDSAATFQEQSDVDGGNGYGKFSIDNAGHWTYAMNNAHDEFVGGQDYTDSITVKTADGTSQVITVTMHGTNDAPMADSDTSNDHDSDTATATTTDWNETNGTDVKVGSATDNTISGGNGGDKLYGAGGNDTLNGNNGVDQIYGQAGNDTLNGDNDGDTLFGGSGDDLLIGGGGGDQLWGGSGNDTFKFTATADSSLNGSNAADTIQDFHHGFDKIDVTAIDAYTANPNTAGDQAFTWGGTTATVHGVWYTEDVVGNNTALHFDTNGTTGSDEMTIILKGVGLGLTASDFDL